VGCDFAHSPGRGKQLAPRVMPEAVPSLCPRWRLAFQPKAAGRSGEDKVVKMFGFAPLVGNKEVAFFFNLMVVSCV
jgi:hypothetical protein